MRLNWSVFAIFIFYGISGLLILSCLASVVEIADNQTNSTVPPVTTNPVESTLNQVNKLLNESQTEQPKKPKVILILADGVRWDYVQDSNLVNFERMRKRGAKAEYVQPIFPSYSYPNWYTIVTGTCLFFLSNLSFLQINK